jgi:hypothetical protein
MKKLYYAKLNSHVDIEELLFESVEDMLSCIVYDIYGEKPDKKRVILIGYKEEIIITDTDRLPAMEMMLKTLSLIPENKGIEDFEQLHVQEYESYEAAYDVALMMREPNELCYEKPNYVK